MSTPEAAALKATVKALSDQTETITADFVQYKRLDFLSDDIKSEGKLAFKSPSMVKWEYVKPFAYSVLFKNETLFINDNGNKSDMDMGSNKIFKQLNQLITASIKGDMFDASEFEVSYFKKDGNSEVHFNPKDKQFAEFIKSFHITFNTKGEVQEVKMIEPSDDYTQIVFSNRTTNQPLSDAVFAQ
ncbi:outer membrane lipoprotein carrier protein LolA [Maribacter algarum]|uniref:Outer membrane lipoprotein carrier protein LolA n=2 Tax=Maribacter algarum (ex Zhang et al. 2020) TaxID=2578118 RepID=A0A5S3PX10_9FLAO|nr:outer membrane lipoprotein carrier protein LolA [Maribacter algarum]